MRAVIVLGGDAPGCALLARCVRDAELTIAADRGLAAFDAASLTPDLLVGDMDSIAPDVLKRYESRVAQRRLSPIKDDTDGVDALDMAMARGATQITLLGALGGRLDHALANLMLLVRASRRGVRAEILDERVRIARVDGEARLHGAKGDTVSLLPLGIARGVTIEGFFYPLQKGELTSEYPLGISNVVTQDEARVTVEEGDLLLFHHGAGGRQTQSEKV